MASTSLGATLFTIALLAGVASGIISAAFNGASKRHLVWGALIGCYLVFIARAVLLPLQPKDVIVASYDGTEPLRRAWTWGSHIIWPWQDQALPDRILNVALFIPVGALSSLAYKYRPRSTVISAFALSSTFELTQLAISLQLGYVYRTFDINDIIDNTFGALIGLGVVAAFRSVRGP